MMTHYDVLKITPQCDFPALRKAYYRRAKECHPDLHGNLEEKTEEFKQVVEAFNVLSDPVLRAEYDRSLALFRESSSVSCEQEIIMDTEADDTLEELIVGNDPPAGTTLFTLLQDLKKTVVFITGREAKNHYARKHYRRAAKCYHEAVVMAPGNILFRVYLARCLARTGRLREAAVHYRTAISLGSHRDPVQHLHKVRQELRELNRRRIPFFGKLLQLFRQEESVTFRDPEQEMIHEMERVMEQMLAEGKRRERKMLK